MTTPVFSIGSAENPNEYRELIRMFLPADGFTLDTAGPPRADSKDGIKRLLYADLMAHTGRGLDWGILTGVKPLKLFASLAEASCPEAAMKTLAEDYYVAGDKVSLLAAAYRTQAAELAAPAPGAVGVYVGIPFCPTRCAYCSFASNPADPAVMEAYMAALEKEIRFTGGQMATRGLLAESVYVGGGTPTTLGAAGMARLLDLVAAEIPQAADCERTVEAGRPDTVDAAVTQVLASKGVRRISINPQSMKEETLKAIGRSHSIKSVGAAFALARAAGIQVINTDIIAGLAEETVEDFQATLDAVMALAPENITVHTLSLKKGSRLREEGTELCYNKEGRARQMLRGLDAQMGERGYRPYYLYRQKQMLDNLENVGYALPGSACVYNVRIMEEKQTILALGAGGSSKVYYPAENRIERVFNVSDVRHYIARIDEMIERKRRGIFYDECTEEK
ncbi:MAG: coproporphyrinogen dehydrogenase HemZ [Clostridiales Family XIII bacterium]|jgi:oxygen-independent coproporphyrinogen-3 oxidase|nr:coproporphyrinogen dehydrogenase HemZ [Clostridiales Family XIII bacterium]